jgi:hypothetical protein
VDVARPAPYVGSVRIHNVDPAQRAAISVVDKNAAPGAYSLVWNSFSLDVSGRLPGGGRLVGGWGMARGATDNCQDVINLGDNPNDLRFCNQNAFPHPFVHELKLSGSLPFSLPVVGELNTGFAILGVPGSSLGEAFRYSNSTAASNQTLYRPPFYTAETCVAPCVLNGRMVTSTTVGTSPSLYDITLLPTESVKFFPRLTQVDFNIAKVFRIGSWRYDVRLEMFNMLNNAADRTHAGAPVALHADLNERGFGTSAGAQILQNYERATNVLDGRVFRLALTGRF